MGTDVIRPEHGIKHRHAADFVLFSVTVVELTILIAQASAFTLVDWIYISQHLIVLGVAP